MIVRRVHVKRFRKLVDQVLECGPGLNVVRGQNDAGKSTLHLAFSAALFPIRPSEAQSYGPWGEERPGEISVEFEADGHTYRLHKDLSLRKVLLTSDDERRWETPKAVEEQIGKVLGLTSLGLFRATAHIGQWELAAVQEEKLEIGTRLARIMTGGDGDAGRIIKALRDRIQRLEVGLRHPSKTPGPLKRDTDRIAHLTEEQRRLEAEVEAIERAAAERDRMAARTADLERQVQEDAAVLEANRLVLDLERKSSDLGRRAAELRALLDRIEAASRDVDAAARDEALAAGPLDPEAVQTLREAVLRARMLREESLAPESQTAACRPSRAASGPAGAPLSAALGRSPEPGGRMRVPWWVRPAVIAAAAAGLGGVALLLAHDVAWGAAALIVAVLVSAAAIVAHRQTEAIEAKVRSWQREDADRRAASRRGAALEASEAVRRMLEGLGATSAEEVFARQERYAVAVEKRDAATRMLDGLLGGRTREAVAEEYQQALVALGAAQAQRDQPDLALRRLDPVAFQRFQTQAEARKQELEAVRAELHGLEGRLKARSPHEDLARVNEELAETRARLARAQRHVEVLTLTRDVLEEAYKHTIVPGKEQLEDRAGEYLRVLSGGAYDRITVDAQTLAPRVWVGPPKAWADVAAREIGSGAVDQCYLALRLALVDLLSGGRRPPLFLDDPFLAYDEDRQAAALGLLRELSRARQVFLFTCRGVYDACADHLLLLGAVRASAPAP